MRRPTRVNIIGHKFTLAFFAHVKADDDEDVLGTMSHDVQLIAVSEGQGFDVERDTVVHEVVHAVFSMSGIARTLPSDTEEDIVKRISPILLAVIRDNPRLIEYLSERQR